MDYATIIEMSRKITIYKWKGNTQWSVDVEDSYGTEHHLGYYNELSTNVGAVIEAKAKLIWKNEVEPKEDLMGKAVAECIEMDKEIGIDSNLWNETKKK